MRWIRGKHYGRAAYVKVGIVDPANYHAHKLNRTEVLTGLRHFRALIDTGATTTMITTRVATSLNLQPAGIKTFRNSTGTHPRLSYIFYIAFHDRDIGVSHAGDDGDQHYLVNGSNGPVSNNYVLTRDIIGGEVDDLPDFDVLLGMDVISTGVLTIDKNGTFSFAF